MQCDLIGCNSSTSEPKIVLDSGNYEPEIVSDSGNDDSIAIGTSDSGERETCEGEGL